MVSALCLVAGLTGHGKDLQYFLASESCGQWAGLGLSSLKGTLADQGLGVRVKSVVLAVLGRSGERFWCLGGQVLVSYVRL